MMATKVVSFREDEAILAELEAKGMKPGEVAKQAFEREIARLRRLEAIAYFKENPLPGDVDAEAAIREIRDA